MTSSFSTNTLVDGRVLVSGTDKFGTQGRCVVDGSQWSDVNFHSEYSQASEDFDAAVEAFFAPLTEAAEKLEEITAGKPTDSISYVVLHEGSPGAEAIDETLVKLTRDSIILRLIESGDTERLVWVDDTLEVLSA